MTEDHRAKIIAAVNAGNAAGKSIRDSMRDAGLLATQAEHGLLGRMAHGVAGLTKAALGIDRASEEVITSRRSICAGCEHSVLRGGVIQQCKLCGCSIGMKILIKGETCPDKRWMS